jgi:hypothetical protein
MRMRRITLSCFACLAVPYFSALSHKLYDFCKNVTEWKCVSIFCTTCVWKISHSKKNSARYCKCTVVCKWSTSYSSQILMKLEFSRQIFDKYSTIKFHENPSTENRVVPCGQTDRKAEMTKLTDTFRNFANAPKSPMVLGRDRVSVCGFTANKAGRVRTGRVASTLTETALCPTSGSSPAPPAGTLLTASPEEPCCSCCTSTEASARFWASSSLMRLCSATISSRRPCARYHGTY